MTNIKVMILTAGVIAGSLYAGYSLAESTVTTTTGTYKCDSACVVDENGNVTDAEGGNVWKLVTPTAPNEP